MVDRDLLDKMLEELQGQVTFLRKVCPPTAAALLTDRLDYGGILYELQTAIQRVLDVGAHLLASETGVTPDEYRSVLRSLGEQGIVPAPFAQRVAPMAGFRNILVHEYAEIDPDQVYRVLREGLDDLQQFIAYVHEYLETRDQGGK